MSKNTGAGLEVLGPPSSVGKAVCVVAPAPPPPGTMPPPSPPLTTMQQAVGVVIGKGRSGKGEFSKGNAGEPPNH